MRRIDAVERLLVVERAASGVPQGRFDLAHLRAIHRHLFQDVFDWAGELRTVETSKFGDYAYAYARTEKLDAVKAETILRDLFKARTGQSMNQMREALVEREEKLPDGKKARAFEYATAVAPMIEKGTKISFNRAFARQAQAFAAEVNITDAGAKRLMKEEFAAAEGRDLYEYGKEIEAKFYKPQIEAEKEARENARDRTGQDRPRSASGNGGNYRRSQPRMRP